MFSILCILSHSMEPSILEDNEQMYVLKRSGKLEVMSFDKIMKRIKKCGEDVGIHINYTSLAMKVIEQLYNKIPTTKIDELTAEQCYTMSSIHYDYATLASRIIHSNHHGNTSDSFSAVMTSLYRYLDKHGKSSPLVSEKLYKIVKKNKKEFDNLCDYSRDFLIDYFGFKTLERSYLMHINKRPVERIQHMWLRVSIGIHGENLERVKETYYYMSQKYFIHATPTLFNAGTPHPQLSSCFLLGMEEDSITGIYNTLRDCSFISKWGGGIGLHIHNVRATGSHIRGTNGTSNGIVPMLRVFNNTAKYVDQCVLPNTVLYTTDGPKAIQDCVVGKTAVYNALGQTEIIQNVLEHSYDGKVLQILTENDHEPLVITDKHPVYAMRAVPEYSQEEGGYLVNTLEWIEAGDLSVGDLIAHPIPTWFEDVPSLSWDDCYFYGILMAFGDLDVGLPCLDENHSPYFHTVRTFIERYLNEKIVETTVEKNRLIWSRSIQLPIRQADIYDERSHKRFHARWLNLPVEKTNAILKGFLDCLVIERDSPYMPILFLNDLPWSPSKTRLLEGFKKQLMEGLRFLCLKAGVLLSADNHIPRCKEIVNLLNLEPSEDDVSIKRHGNLLLSPIVYLKEETYKGVLYDLQMKTQHDYLLQNGLVHNGGGKRNGSFAIYLEPWHADIQAFLQMKKNHGEEELKARDLFYALWIPDLFMERMHRNEKWTLMCPDECPGLSDVWGDKFQELYEKYEKEGRGRETINARDLWIQIMDAQMETGTPYLLYKDTANRKSNQKNLGTIKSSNLCCEIIEYSDGQESAVCNLGSIALASFVQLETKTVDYEKLHAVSRILTYNLNTVIDVNYYPTDKTEKSNFRSRPIGIGVQGLADVFMMLHVPFDSEEAKEINRHIFETIYHGALEQSCEMAKEFGAYETFAGSPSSQGILQFDMWDVQPGQERYDWEQMKQDVREHGLRNSLLLAPMPTASTSQILGFNECFEPITSNIYSRGTSAGQFMMVNKYLMKDLIALGLWNEHIKNNIIANNGSIQQVELIPESLRNVYKTVWEIPMKSLIFMAAERGAYICQSQSLNLWLEDPNYKTLTSMHYYGWKQGLKTGIYYLRRRGKHQAQKFTIEPDKYRHTGGDMEEDENDICEMCSS